METQLNCEPKLSRSGHRSFSIDSLLSNNYNHEKPINIEHQSSNDLTRNSLHYHLEIESLAKDVRWKECLANRIAEQQDYLEADVDLAQKHLNLVRHIKNIDYLPWISTTNALSHRDLYEEAISRTTSAIPEPESLPLPHQYSGLHLPSFVYSSWLPVANSSTKFNERSDIELPYSNGYCRTSPRTENIITDSEDSKSDSSRMSDTPKDFSCPKQRPSGKFTILIWCKYVKQVYFGRPG